MLEDTGRERHAFRSDAKLTVTVHGIDFAEVSPVSEVHSGIVTVRQRSVSMMWMAALEFQRVWN